MNILVLNWQDIKNPLSGGAEVHLHEIFRRLAAGGHSVTLCCSRFPGSAATEVIDGIRLVRAGGRSLFNAHVPWLYESRFRREPFDIVVDDINKIPFYSPPFVGKPLAGILHHLFGGAIYHEAPFFLASYVYAAEKLATRVYRNTPMAVVSESTRRELIESGFPAGNIVIIRGAVDPAVYRPSSSGLQGDPVVGYLGRLKQYKSIDHLLRAFRLVLRELPSARLKLVGEGDHRTELERLAHSLGIRHRVEFTGYVSEAKKVEYLRRMTVAVNCSMKEGWGLTVIEANACGVPVIASDVPGLRDSILDGKTGLLYEYGNVNELAGKILRILRDESLRSGMCAEAIAWGQSFCWEESAGKMVDFLERTIEQHRSHPISAPH